MLTIKSHLTPLGALRAALATRAPLAEIFLHLSRQSPETQDLLVNAMATALDKSR